MAGLRSLPHFMKPVRVLNSFCLRTSHKTKIKYWLPPYSTLMCPTLSYFAYFVNTGNSKTFYFPASIIFPWKCVCVCVCNILHRVKINEGRSAS